MRGTSKSFVSCTNWPTWVPVAARNYLAHIETGSSIRSLARENGCHASTILRRIRHFEAQRDDILVDAALQRLASRIPANTNTGSRIKERIMTVATETSPTEMTEIRLQQEAPRILRRLCEPGAILAVAAKMENAVVVRDAEAESSLKTAVVTRDLAEAMALKGWISCDAPGRISRYCITSAGRAALNKMLAGAENRASGFADTQTSFDTNGSETLSPSVNENPSRSRYNLAESPLIALARRKDRDGERFLPDELVHAGERLREDFELSHIGPQVTQNWEHFLTGGVHGRSGKQGLNGAQAARSRVEGALQDLGPGLGDIVLRCCCHLEGLERAEKRMGWSARSGKIVLRIALQRLKRHYECLGDAGGMIG